jgi:phosphoserine phosphatase RsbU/P
MQTHKVGVGGGASLAGHLPILHYRHGSSGTVRLSMEQLPLGLIPGGSYASKRVIYSPRDLFLMVTDGITEVTNARDEEFGLTRLQELLTRHATRALPEIWDLIMREVRQYGLQQDDQGLLSAARAGPGHPSRDLNSKRGAGTRDPVGRTMSDP